MGDIVGKEAAGMLGIKDDAPKEEKKGGSQREGGGEEIGGSQREGGGEERGGSQRGCEVSAHSVHYPLRVLRFCRARPEDLCVNICGQDQGQSNAALIRFKYHFLRV